MNSSSPNLDDATKAMPHAGSTSNTNSSIKEKEPFKARPELYAPARLAPKVYELFRTRSLVIDVLARECVLVVLLAAKIVSNRRPRSCSEDETNDSISGLPRVGIIGGSHVGSAVTMALLRHQYPMDKLVISTRQPERIPKCDALQTAQAQTLFHAIPKYYDNARASKESDVLVLCMPPSQLKSVAIQIKHALCVPDQPTLVVSVLCGASVDALQKACGSKLVTRTKVHVVALTASGGITASVDADKELFEDVGNGAGGYLEEWVNEEQDVDQDNKDGRSRRRSSHCHQPRDPSTKQSISSVMTLAIRELGRTDEDVMVLVQLLAELGRRVGRDDAVHIARTAVFGYETEASATQDACNEQLEVRPRSQEEDGDAKNNDEWLTGWDQLLVAMQTQI
ncbi:Pyrroline-5-carboxylate reductase, partial [Globisporangium splendens]